MMYLHDKTKPVLVTVAIPTYQRSKYLLDALQSVIVNNVPFKFEVIILDNGCDCDLQLSVADIAKTTSIPIRYVQVEELGLHNGRNLGAILAKGEIVVYIDDDVIVPSGWLESLCQPFNNPKVGGVGGKILPKWEAVPPDWLKLLDSSYFSLLDLGDSDRDMTFPETPYGCNMAYRRELILSLGGFSPDGIGGAWIEWQRGDGETGFAYKVYKEGYRIAYSGRAWLYHRIPAQRQTHEFAYRRTIKGAVSSAYFYCRQVKLSRSRLSLQALKCILKMSLSSIKQLFKGLQPVEKRLPQQLDTIYYAISALYVLRAIIDPNLRHWISKPDYWPTQVIPKDFLV